MSSRFLLCIFLYLLSLHLCTAITNQRQITLSAPEPEFFTDYPIENINLAYKEDETLSNKQICENFQEIYTAFGDQTFASYRNCNEKYFLLGEDHSVIKSDKPACFLNLIPVFCEFDIQMNPEALFSNGLTQFVTRTIKACLAGDANHDSVCQTLNLETQLVQNEKEFCANLQTVSEDTIEESDEATQEMQDSVFKVYSFVGENSQVPCVAITKLYNFCQQSSQKLGLDPSKCYKGSFSPYLNGGLLKRYNSKAKKACSNLLIPYFSYFVSDVNNISDAPKVCVDIESKNLAQINQRQTEVKEEIENLKANQTDSDQKILSLKDIQEKAAQKENEVKKFNQTWTSSYGQLINKNSQTYAIKPDQLGTLGSLNVTLNGWATTAKSSLDLLRYMNPSDKILAGKNELAKSFELSPAPQKTVSETTQLLKESLTVCAKQKQDATKTQDCTNLDDEEFLDLNDIALEGDRKYSGFFTVLENKISIEMEEYKQESEGFKSNINEHEKYIENYQEQIKLSDKYND